MASTRVSARKQKESDYSNVGHVGRKTGVTLPDTGVRDQHGLPPLPEMDTLSPGESEAGRKVNGNATLTEGEMEIGHSTIAEPTELLSAKRPHMPPPRSRSPIKTSLGSSPRRSIGYRTSARLSNGSQHRSDPPSSTPEINMVESDDQVSEVHQVEDANSPSNAVVARKRGRKPKNRSEQSLKRPFQQRQAEPRESLPEQSGEDDQPAMLEVPGSSHPLALEEDSIPEPAPASLDDETPEHIPNGESVEDVTRERTAAAPAKGKRGRPKKQPQSAPNPSASIDLPTVAQATSKETAPKRSKAVDVFRGPEDEVEEGPAKPSKRPKVDRAPKKKPPPAARHPNSTIKSKAGRSAAAAPRGRKRKAPEPPQSPDNGGSEMAEEDSALSAAAVAASSPAPSAEPSVRGPSRPKPRSLALLRSETPQDTAQYTRSGRTSVKPCAFWRGERLVYGEAKADGQRLSLPAIKEVIRTEEVVEDPAPTPARKKGRKRKVVVEEVTEDDGKQEKWEREPGNLVANVMAWDPYEGKASGEDLEQIELAVAPKGFEELVKEVKNQKFRYAKTVALPFFHSGMVDLPPGGEKRVKNSRRNHMVFWVFSGRVKVDINGLKFGIGRGGMWQVPRGNFYGLRNPYKQAARIFFAQGSYMNEAEVEAEDGGGSVEGVAEGSIPA